MNYPTLFFLVATVALTSCSSNKWTFEPSPAKPVVLEDPTIPETTFDYLHEDPTLQEIIAGYDYLHDLHEHNRIPGDTKDMHGTPASFDMIVQQPSGDVLYPFSWTFYVVLDGQAGFTNCYTVGRESKISEWKLERAWRVDTNGATIKEWQLK